VAASPAPRAHGSPTSRDTSGDTSRDTPARRTRVALLGSTGSIGRQAVDVLSALRDEFEVVAIAAGRDRETLEAQVARLQPTVVALADDAARRDLRLPAGVALEAGPGALERIAARDDVDLVVVGTGGVVSLRPVIAALESGKVVATANKETLVSGGHLVMPLARALARRAAGAAAAAGDGAPAASGHSGSASAPGLSHPWASPLAWLRPIDSEHSAIWQCLAGEETAAIERIWLTASGGPFRGLTAAELARVTPAMALAHPTWRMGAKITVDSATLMNKGLEVIEAERLYDVGLQRIAVVVHPQSVIHSAVEFVDGSIKAQLGHPDMRMPIQYALTFPARRPSPARRLQLDELADLSFQQPDEERFPALAIARAAGASGPRASATLIAADEVAVRRFLDGSLSFPGIPRLVGSAVERFGAGPAPGLDELIALDAEVRAWCDDAPAVGA
jgi:1-deoxy-D-xylulose-5-phosphate reductoisomerase